MEILKFENSPRPARKKSSSSRILLGFASVAAVAMLGSTLAASITLNSNAAVEFGQGVAQAAACDSSITLTPFTSFVNGNPGNFQLETITATGVDITDATKCLNKFFKISAYDSATATALGTYSFYWGALGAETVTAGTVALSGSTTGGIATIVPTSKLNLTTSDVAKLTLETSGG